MSGLLPESYLAKYKSFLADFFLELTELYPFTKQGKKILSYTNAAPDVGEVAKKNFELFGEMKDVSEEYIIWYQKIEDALGEKRNSKKTNQKYIDFELPESTLRLMYERYRDDIVHKPQMITVHTVALAMGYMGWQGYYEKEQKIPNYFKLKSKSVGKAEISKKEVESDLLKYLRQGSKTYLDQKYDQLNISKILIPKWKKEQIKANVKINEQDISYSLIDGVEKLWKEKNRNCLLVGEGGMGKTYSLIQIWRHYLNQEEKNYPIPIYVSLNRYNDIDEKERSGFITNYIIENYLQRRYFTDEDRKELWNLFMVNSETEERTSPVFILLLDGFNEITVNQTNIRKDMDDWWFSKPIGVQIIISSRYDMRFDYRWHMLQRVDLQNLSEQKISEYLNSIQILPPKDKELMKILSNPMMLTLFASTSEIMDQYSKFSKFAFKMDFTSQGELMWNFFESQLAKYFETIKYDDTEFAYYSFLIKHIIPYIGFEMEREGIFNISEKNLVEVIDMACVVFYSENFENTFPMYRNYISKFDLGEKQFPHKGVRFDKIAEILVNKLQLLIEENYTYRFIHQNFRDFSASVHYLNDINLAMEQNKIPPALKGRSLPLYVKKYIGEVSGEHKKKVKFDVKSGVWGKINFGDSTLDIQLNKLRGIFDEDLIGHSVKNIVEIFKQSRNELTGCDLSNLDLRNVYLNNVRCFRKWDKVVLGVCFDGALISEENFSKEGMHAGTIYTISFSPDGEKITTGSFDKTVKEWNAETGDHIRTYSDHEFSIKNLTYSNDGKRILSEGINIKELYVESKRVVDYGKFFSVNGLLYHPDDRRFFLPRTKKGILKCFQIDSKETAEKKEYDYDSNDIEFINYSPDRKYINVGSKDGVAECWNWETKECIKKIAIEKESRNRFTCDSEFSKIAVCTEYYGIHEFNIDTNELQMIYTASTSIESLVYNPKGDRLCAGLYLGGIEQWETTTGRKLWSKGVFSNEMMFAAYSPNEEKIIAFFSDGYVKEWSMDTRRCINTFFVNSFSLKAQVAYSPDGNRFIVNSDKSVIEYSTQTGEMLRKYETKNWKVTCLSYDGSGSKIIAGGREVSLWDTETGDCLRVFEKPLATVIYIASSPFKDRFATISEYGMDINEWDLNTGKHIKRFSGYYKNQVKVKYQNDGETLVSFSKNNKVCKWNLETGEMLYPYNKPRYFMQGDIFERFDDVNTYKDVCSYGEKILWYKSKYNRFEEMLVKGAEFLEGNIPHYSGLLINGCSFKNLHQKSNISGEFKKTMIQNEAVFSSEKIIYLNPKWKKKE